MTVSVDCRGARSFVELSVTAVVIAATVREFAGFVCLQVLDFASTMACLSSGLAEGNPAMRAWMNSCGDACTGMFVAKIVSVLVASRCCDPGYFATVRLANLGYGLIVAWNVFLLASISSSIVLC